MSKINKKTFRRDLGLIILFLLLPTFGLSASGKQEPENPIWLDSTLPLDERVDALVDEMSLREKISQLVYQAKAIPRLGIPTYNWWNESLHGVARAGYATVFPQAIGLASTWDTPLIFEVATAISDEGRAKYHDFIRKGQRGKDQGITFWSPNINQFRDPRWGRGQETYGEDPFLAAEIAIPYIKGIQGDHPEFRKADATIKHFAVHSGPEPLRHVFDANCTDRELREYYLYAFEKTVKEAQPAALMGAYNRFRGESTSASPYLFGILKNEWGFDGYIVSDCGAINDIWLNHGNAATQSQAAALGVKEGCDLNCGRAYRSLMTAIHMKYITEDKIDESVKRLMKTRILLGMFASDEENPYAEIPIEVNDSEPHRRLNEKTAVKSLILLKNDGILPLDTEKYKKITVIGPSADNIDVLVGNYNGTPSKPVTLLEGIRKFTQKEKITLDYFEACKLAGSAKGTFTEESPIWNSIQTSDLVIYCGGLSPLLEGEEGYLSVKAEGFDGGDRTVIELPEVQEKTIKMAAKAGKPMIMLMTTGSAISIASVEDDFNAVLNCWYPGGEGGTAVAQVLFGEVSPAGKLPVTFYRATTDLPHFEDYSLKNRTYQFFTGTPLYPFGHGLTYTTMKAKNLIVATTEEMITATITIKNIGNVTSDEVIQLYATAKDPLVEMPLQKLAGFKRIHLIPDAEVTLSIELDPRAFQYWNVENEGFEFASTQFDVKAGFSSSDIRQIKELQL